MSIQIAQRIKTYLELSINDRPHQSLKLLRKMLYEAMIGKRKMANPFLPILGLCLAEVDLLP